MSTSGQQAGRPDAAAYLSAQGPPYPPQGASLGGVPITGLDVPVSAVVAFLFALAASLNMAVFQLNRRRGHKFAFSAALFGFCIARFVANIMRIVWARSPRNVGVAIAASILRNAAVVILFVVNLFLALRLLRGLHPRLGWSSPVGNAFTFLVASVVACLAMVIVTIVYNFCTLDTARRHELWDVQLVAVVYLAVLAFVPVPVVLVGVLLPRRDSPVENFDIGTMHTKIAVLLFASLILTLGAGFRAGVAFVQRPADHPAWFHSKASYYCFNYLIELVVVFTYLVTRFDLCFHVPDGSSQPGHYSRGVPTADKKAANFDDFVREHVVGQDQQAQQVA